MTFRKFWPFASNGKIMTEKKCSSVVKHVAIGTGGLKFDYRAGQIERRVANGSTPLCRFFRTELHRL